MRKLLAIVLISAGLVATVRAEELTPEAKAFKAGLQKGIEVGVKFEKNKLRQELVNYWGIADTIFNYKYLFLSGEVPPPLVIDRTVVKRDGNGVARIERELNVLPPAYFPVDRIVSLRETFGSENIVIPKGFITYIDTKNLPTEKIAYYDFLAQTDNKNPIYIPSKDILIFGSFTRKADAESLKNELGKLGIDNIQVALLDEDLQIKAANPNTRLSQELKELAEKMLEKEKAVYGTSAYSFKRSLSGVIYYLQKAMMSADTIDPRRYPDLDVVRLKADINKIIVELNKYLADHQPYRGILPPASYKDIKELTEIETGGNERKNTAIQGTGANDTLVQENVKIEDDKKLFKNIKDIESLVKGERK